MNVFRRRTVGVVWILAVGLLVSVVAARGRAWRDRFVARSLGAELIPDPSVVKQRSSQDGGPAALCNLVQRLGKPCALDELEGEIALHERRTSMLQLQVAARDSGVCLVGWRFEPREIRAVRFPWLARLRSRHFVVVVGAHDRSTLDVIDPALGHVRIPDERFASLWTGECLVTCGRLADPMRQER